MPLRTNRAFLTALGLALVLWFGTAVVHAAWTRAGAAPGLVGLVVPMTPAVSLVRGAGSAGGAGVLAVIALLAALAGLVLPALRATRTGAAPRVLAVWFAVIVAGWTAAVVWTLAVAAPMVRYGLLDLLAFGYGEAARAGCAWGVSYGWVVGLVTIAVARRGTEPPTLRRPSGTVVAAATAGVVAAIGWLVVAAAHVSVDETVDRYVTTARSQFALAVREAADWVLPVTTARGAPSAVVLLGGVLVGVVVGTLTWLAARSTLLQGGRLVLFLGVWAAAIVGAVVGGLPTVLASTGLDPDGDGWWVIGQTQLYGVSDGGASGALYGWVPALLVVGILTLAQRRAAHLAAPAPDPEPVPV
ncbi:hypothetical protein [Cellulomonas sp. P5_C5]